MPETSINAPTAPTPDVAIDPAVQTTLEPPSHMRIVRCGTVRPTQFLVLGERSSGTNLLTATIRRTFKLSPYRGGIWKHGFPAFPALPEDCLIIGVTRRADAWARSMFARPWHATGRLRRLGFSEFLRARWDTVVDNRFMHKAYVDTPLMRQALQFDRHPITGQPFANLFRLRTAKLQGLVGLQNREINVAIAPLETILADPAHYLTSLAGAFDLPFPADPRLPDKRMGGADSWARRKVEAPAKLSAEDHAFMIGELDLELEAALGYTYASPELSSC
ncbi:MAG: hypothetical protein AAFU80_14035 [Pseudomonadota bacterium]